MVNSLRRGVRRDIGSKSLHLLFALLLHVCQCFLSMQPAAVFRGGRLSVNDAGYMLLFSASLNEDGQGNDGLGGRRLQNLQLVDTDFMPRREAGVFGHLNANNYALQDWGIEQHEYPAPAFPHSIHAVAEGACQAIVGTWDRNEYLDPSHASNAMSRSTALDYRPVRFPQDIGRLGIEIDGANLLINDREGRLEGQSAPFGSSGSALRKLILVLAGKLSQQASESQSATRNATTSKESNIQPSAPPVAVYFNTVKQALAASRQLQLLQHQSPAPYRNITIHCLGQDDDLPLCMRANHAPPKEKSGKGGKRRNRRKNPAVSGAHPSRGVVIVVKPTDFNEEYRPPGPALGVLPSFQKLIARASADEVPVIMVSPRFQVDVGSGWAQTAGGHQAATYGGSEPPRGPTPWILRDFNPPVYCWVGNAVSLTVKGRHQSHSKPFYSSIALAQSVMEEGYPWHIFAARHHTADVINQHELPYEFEYLASTKASQGRPTRSIMRRILSEFGS